jgi:hypothetical protein
MTEVSVVMGAHNAEEYLGEAIESVLAQTFRDFELIVVDDGSTDRTAGILDGFRDSRIVRVRNEENVGLTRSLNRGLRLAQGRCIARLDADDVSLPQRLERQVALLEARPDVGLVGCPVIYIAPDGRELGVQRIYASDTHQALLDTEFCWEHSAVMFRAECVTVVGPYREAFRYAQDYDLWLRIAERFGMFTLSEPLVKLRLHTDAISIAKRVQQRAYVLLALELARQRMEDGEESTPPSADLAPPEPTLDELGRAHLREACLCFLVGDVDGGRQALGQAVRSDPRLLVEPERLVRRVVAYGFTHATTPASAAGGVRFLNALFDHLPPDVSELGRLRGKALGMLYAISAFESYHNGNPSAVRREATRAMLHDPTWLGSRKIWSAFFRSLVGALSDGTRA